MMKAFLLLLLVGLAATAPTSKELIIDEDFYPTKLLKYTSEYDIVNILVSLYLYIDEVDGVLFFAEADIIDGKKDYKGVSVMKKNKVTKLLDNGRDMTAFGGHVFIGASDGIYIYKDNKTAVEKYGSLNDDIYGIVDENNGEAMYILTASKDVYKVTDEGNAKQKIEDVVKAEQIMLDYSNNLYFYASDKQPYVRTSEGVKKINGLPKNPNYVQLLKPAAVTKDSVPFVVDETTYLIYANGTSKNTGILFKKTKYRPTAYSVEATLLQYYAVDKKIYEYNMEALYWSTFEKTFEDNLVELSPLEDLLFNNIVSTQLLGFDLSRPNPRN